MLVRVNSVRGPTLPSLFEIGHGAFWIIASGASAIVAACIFVPWLAALFAFGQPSLSALALSAAVGMIAVLCFDLLKLMPAVRRALGGSAGERYAK